MVSVKIFDMFVNGVLKSTVLMYIENRDFCGALEKLNRACASVLDVLPEHIEVTPIMIPGLSENAPMISEISGTGCTVILVERI